MNREIKTRQKTTHEDFDFIMLAKTVWSSRLLILKIVAIFFLIGVLIAILSSEEYTATTTFMPQTENSNKAGNLGGLASLAGISLNGTGPGSEIPPSLYPRIINSVKFKRSLLEVPITVNANKQVPYKEFYERFHAPSPLKLLYKYTLGLPNLILNSGNNQDEKAQLTSNIENSELIHLTQNEVKHFQRLSSQMQVIPDQKEGTVELNFTMPQAVPAAEMAKAAEEILQQEVIAFKIQNAREHFEFTKDQFEEKKSDFLQKQKELSRFRDQNKHIASATAMNQQQLLEAQYNFAFSLYSEMAKQLEQSKLQVSKNTPVFSIIDPVSVPTQRSAPKKTLIVLIFTILGMITALGFLFLRHFFVKARDHWKINDQNGA